MSKHTPGPWQVAARGNVTEIHASDSGRLRRVAEVLYLSPIRPGNFEADASLIAAAPELLEACKEAEELLLKVGDSRKDADLIRKLHTAIAKAVGESVP